MIALKPFSPYSLCHVGHLSLPPHTYTHVQTFSDELEAMSTAVCFEEEMDSEMSRRLNRVEAILNALLQFCQRNSSKLEERAGQVNWSGLILAERFL